VEYLINKGGDPNARGRHDSTPLHSAAWGRNRQVLEILLENGADVNARTDEGETPGMTASLRGEKETLEILLALSADPHAKDKHGTSLAELAAAGGHKPIFDMLLQIGVKVEHPLHVAAGLGDFKAVKEFLDMGEDVNARDGFGATPLILAAVAGREDMVDFLLERKADPTLPAKDGYSFMHGAAFSGKKSLIRKALSLGMEINARYGPDGITPVDVANEDTDAAAYIRAHGGRTGWELGRP
jgi:cytohesin